MKHSILLILCLVTTVTYSNTIPLESFAAKPMIESARVSPDGTKIAAIYNTEEGARVILSEFGSRKIKKVAGLDRKLSDIDYLYWSGNQYIIIGTMHKRRWYNRTYPIYRVFSLNLADMSFRELIHKHDRNHSPEFHKVRSYFLKSKLRHDKDHILISSYNRKDRAIAVFKVNLKNGKFDKLFPNTYEVDHWYADIDGAIRMGLDREKEGGLFKSKQETGHFMTFWYRKSDEEKFKKLYRRKFGESDTFHLQALTKEGDKAYVISDRVTGRESLWLFDIVKGEFTEMLYGHDKYDLRGTTENQDGEITGVYWYDDFREYHYFSSEDQQRLVKVKGTLKNYHADIVSMDKSKTKVLAVSAKSDAPNRYIWFDYTTNKAGIWFPTHPKLEKQKLSPVKNISFKASDGQEIPGYLTMPVLGSKNKKPPLIVMPHGGPAGRDTKYFNRYLQFFADKGYAVLQVNFRGSTGFGLDFDKQGRQQWGKLMQQDVMDGVDWVQKQGMVSGKACIVGWSYGGYVALTSAFQTPDKFACTISIAGISDLKQLVEDDQRYDFYIDHIVDSSNDEAMDDLDNYSAINFIDKIKSPILLAHGTYDFNVFHEQSEDFYKEAKDKGKNIKYIEFLKGRHSLIEPEERLRLYKEISKFLDKYLPVN